MKTRTEVRVWRFTPWGIVNEQYEIEVKDEVLITTDDFGRVTEEIICRERRWIDPFEKKTFPYDGEC